MSTAKVKIGKFEFKPRSGSNTAFQANIGKETHFILHLNLVAPLCKIVDLCDPRSPIHKQNLRALFRNKLKFIKI